MLTFKCFTAVIKGGRKLFNCCAGYRGKRSGCLLYLLTALLGVFLLTPFSSFSLLRIADEKNSRKTPNRKRKTPAKKLSVNNAIDIPIKAIPKTEKTIP